MATNWQLVSSGGESSSYSSHDSASSGDEGYHQPGACCSKMDYSYQELDTDILEVQLKEYAEDESG